MNIKEKTKKAIHKLMEFLEHSPFREQYLVQVQSMEAKLDEPCVLAVAGEVKTGKSSFINTFLRQDLAMTGITETTATINYFRYGEVPDVRKPVLCVWTNGRQTWESHDFLDSLQGHTEEVLERATNIDHLEFYLNNPRLKGIQLVDTPGTTAHVGEDGQAHQNRTAKFLQMESHLRDRHNNETQAISRNADAVIYLMTGHAANQENVNFLHEFIGNASIKSYNSVGIMGKIDTDDALLANLSYYVESMSRIVNERLPIPIPILPISAGIQRAVDTLGDDGLRHLQSRLQEGFSEYKPLERALGMADRFDGEECRGCSLSQSERLSMHKGLPWRSFVVIARELYQKELTEAKQSLLQLAGFDAIEDVLDRQFLQRGMILRCCTVLQDCCDLLWNLLNCDLNNYIVRIDNETKDAEKFIDFIMSHPDFTENGIGGQIRRYLDRHLEKDDSENLKRKLTVLNEIFQNLLYDEVSHTSDNYAGLQMLEKASADLSPEELQELTNLFRQGDSLMAMNVSELEKRQLYWRNVTFVARSQERRQLGELASNLYGVRIAEFQN